MIGRLRAIGFDVVSIAETRPGARDKDVIQAADAEGCILITEDRDFGELVIRQRLDVRGMILLDWIAFRTLAKLTRSPKPFPPMPTNSSATLS